MYGVVSLLDATHVARVEKLWRELRRRCDVSHVATHMGIPHISHHVVEDYDFAKLTSHLRQLADSLPAFRARTAGLGVFSGAEPVAYIAVVRSQALSDAHRRIWECAQRGGKDSFEYYRPERWVPHITLAQHDLDKTNIGEAVAHLSQYSLTWEIPVTRLAVIAHDDGQAEIIERFDLRK